jgi:Spy/CpxP family protein refolding chaperone
MSQTSKVVAAFFGVFVAGAVFGGALAYRWAQPVTVPPAPVAALAPTPESQPAPAISASPRFPSPLPPAQVQPALMRQFTQRLKLTSDQREKIAPVVTRTTDELARLRRENLHETSRLTEAMYAEVAAALTPGQVVELEKMKRKMQERVAEERKKRGGEPTAEPGRKGERGPAGRVGAQ